MKKLVTIARALKVRSPKSEVTGKKTIKKED